MLFLELASYQIFNCLWVCDTYVASLSLSLSSFTHIHIHTRYTQLNYVNILSRWPSYSQNFSLEENVWWMKNSWDCFQHGVWRWTQLKTDKLEERTSITQNTWVNCVEGRHQRWGDERGHRSKTQSLGLISQQKKIPDKNLCLAGIKIWQRPKT